MLSSGGYVSFFTPQSVFEMLWLVIIVFQELPEPLHSFKSDC